MGASPEGRAVVIKEYTTAVNAKVDEGTEDADATKFKIDGREVTAYRPDEAMIAIVIGRTGSRATPGEVGAAAIDFFYSVLDDKSARWIEDRLFDRKDPFGLEQILEILFDLVEEWTGRPTERPSAS